MDDADIPARLLLANSSVTEILDRLTDSEIEQHLLSAAMHNPAAYAKAGSGLQPDDFAFPVHAAIWHALGQAYGENRKVDHLLIGDLARRFDADLQDHGGGQAYVAELFGLMANAKAAQDYGRRLSELAKRRRLVTAAITTVATAPDLDTPLDELLGGIMGEAERLVETGRARTRGAVLDDMLESFRHPPVVYSTGMPSLDAAMGGGLWPGRVYGIAAHDKAGKTGLAGTISYNLNEAGIPHGYFAFEMGSDQIEHRQLSRALGIGTTRILERQRDVLEAIARYRISAADHVVYVDMPGGTVDELRSEILAARAKHRITGFVVDYWQLIEGKGRQQSDEEHLRRVAQWLATAAKRLNLWVIVLAQLADDGEATALSRRGLNRAVDQLYFLHRKQGEEFGWLQMKVSRYTPPGDVGGQNDPSLRLRYPGPWFEDWKARGSDDTRQAQYELAEG